MNINRKWSPFLLCAITVLAVSCDKKADKNETDTAIHITTVTAEEVEAGDGFVVSGNVEGQKTVDMGFLVSGRIADIKGEEGSLVSKGALIATIDPTNYAIAKELADVQVSQAADEYERLKLMHDRKSVSESDFNKSRFALDGAKAQQKLRAKDLADTKLYAEIGGILLKKRAEEGEIVSAGIPILTIADISRVKVCAYIPENRLKEVKIGQEVKVRIDAIDKEQTGTVKEVGGVADPATRSFTIKTELDNPGLSIRPGMIAEVSFAPTGGAKILAIRSTSLLHTPDGTPYVYVIDPKTNRAYRRNVSVGSLRGEYIEIVSGLRQGEIVAAGGKQKLSNGSIVSISK